MPVVLASRPGTGKTTLARLLTAKLTAAYLRIDEIAKSLIRAGCSPIWRAYEAA